ncbi:conserved Plasmodium protein, unknown function [Plasmodium knowlesi strain H]|uniref:Uncharacterized protein n=3 Tax=Plasmodium knowlesi TaxID=5850 RepID=A0A5K1VH16_PLAKH|nr:conserved Plasmodium protein, unknown function [Plasmodium knowlesi strain H]OTN67565.1 Uncharacterized protein PKNOH_S06429900 [Plasmodium knowlesi]CAA9987569.1 conserved Plasmodium protein, unknown function [Plasmodium knowlesi strain H]SBO27038.1 conserved Plasmodium protein, unknown function [Plasmodium knowlesi strain H]SBO29206.1 conserved Plasmodium protein, unknown function [Plasmodium knowlesi strain H]VVS77043.1 conserved Plasmodium protein, unknown function [Plasmodium knowlesi s|eukprot:XP_002258572.1 hypothetical protein, conserved in Plasmodium species [Plasmodium knowlesi strain H]
MENLEELLRQYEETKRELLERVGVNRNNGATKSPRRNKHYVEKTILHSLDGVINAYCTLVILHREGRHSHKTNKRKGEPKNGDNRRNIKDTCKNRWSGGRIAHDELTRKVAQRKATQGRHIERVSRFVKTDKAIGIFGKYVEKVFRLRSRSTCDGDAEQIDGSELQGIDIEDSPRNGYRGLPKRRIKIILEKDIHFDLFLGAVLNFLQVLLHTKSHPVYAQANCVKHNPPCMNGSIKEDKKNWWSRMLSKGGKEKEFGLQAMHINRLPSYKERIPHFVVNPHGPSNPSKDTAHDDEKKKESNLNDEERERQNKDDPFKYSPSGENSPFYPMDMEMLLWSSLLDGNHHTYNYIIGTVDPNMLYIIDSDRSLLKILFFFNVVHLFATYMYVTLCRNELLFSSMSVFVTILGSFHGEFKLVSNGATEWKNAYPFLCAFASLVRRNILSPSTGKNNVSDGGNQRGNTEVDRHKTEYEEGKGNSHLLQNFGGLCFGDGRRGSSGSDARKGILPEGLNNQKEGKGKRKNEQIGTPPDDEYCYYGTVTNEDEIDSVNLAINVTNTSKENISFYKRYIEEHIQRVFLDVYKLNEAKKGECSREKNKEDGISDPSIFKNYRELFRSFFQEIVS